MPSPSCVQPSTEDRAKRLTYNNATLLTGSEDPSESKRPIVKLNSESGRSLALGERPLLYMRGPARGSKAPPPVRGPPLDALVCAVRGALLSRDTKLPFLLRLFGRFFFFFLINFVEVSRPSAVILGSGWLFLYRVGGGRERQHCTWRLRCPPLYLAYF